MKAFAGTAMPAYPKSRLDALTDGIFAVAMTILVLDLRIPDEGAHPMTEASMAQAFVALAPRFFPYVLSFYVLGVSWLSLIKVKSRGETVGAGYTRCWLIYLLLVTCVPFTTVVVGRYATLPIASSAYAANIGLMAFAGHCMMSLLPDPLHDEHWLDRRVSLLLLLFSCLLTMGLSWVFASRALYAFLLNVAAPLVVRYCARRAKRPRLDAE